MKTKKLETVARKLPPFLTRFGKRIAVRLRAKKQLQACRKGYINFGDVYKQPILFIAGFA